VAYRADIEIAVIGADKLRSLRKNLDEINNKLKEIDENAELFDNPIRSLASFNKALQTAQQNLNLVELAADDEAKAIKGYVKALEASNDAAARQNQLIQREVTLRNKAKKSIETRKKRDEFLAGPGRTIRAEKSAQRATRESARRQREFAEIEAFNKKINRIEANFNAGQERIRRDADNAELRRLLKRLKLEESKVKEIGQLRAKIDKKALDDFDRRLRESSTLRGQSSPIGGARNIPGSPAARRRTNVGRAVGAGLATVNVPGQDIAQAAALGSFAGPKGAAIAAGIAVVAKGLTAVGRAAPEIARTEAQISKLEIALRGILGSKSEEGFKAIDRAARDFNQPIVDATKNFTQLSAAATANGNSVKQTETLYRALSAATKATGGDAQDLSGVLRAATQVISKGVVRSEELRGQIGDRLPGAFQLFAQATNRSAEELQKALEQGEVSADEFVTTFSDFILKKFEPAALRIGDSPAEAGARLTKALEDANRAAGPLLLALGAKFQQFAVDAINELKPLLALTNKTFKLDRAGKNQTLADLEKNIIPDLEKKVAEGFSKDPASFSGIPVPGLFRLPGFRDILPENALNPATKNLELDLQKLARARGTQQQLREELFPTGRGRNPLPSTPEEEDLKGAPKAPKLPVSQTLQLQQSLLQESIKQLDIDTKRRELQATELGAARLQNQALFERLPLQERLLELGRQRALAQSDFPADAAEINQVFDAQLQNLQSQNALLREQVIKREQNLIVAKEIAALEFSQQTEQITVGFERQIEDTGAFDRSEALELQISQTRRREDAERDLTAQIEKLRIAEKGGDVNATAEIERLEGRRQAVLGLLDALSQAEQQQLRFNQAFEAVSPAVNSLVGGLREVVAGTKTAEEAFADFLSTIADQLIQTAATLIAQYIAIGLAKAFAGLSGGSSGLDFNTSAPSITGNSLGDFGGGTPFAGAFRANGGPVSANQPYIVGERGPELLIPQTSGTVLSNEDSRAALAKYSPGNNLLSEAGDSTGTVAGRNETLNPVINISTGPTLQFEGEGYVKQEDFKAGLARAAQEGAKQGQTLTLRKLMMSPTARSKIGI